MNIQRVFSPEIRFIACWILGLLILVFESGYSQSEFWRKSVGDFGDFVPALAVGKKDHLYAGTFGSGILHSTDRGKTWIARNEGLGSKYINSITFNSTWMIFAGTNDAGVFISSDDGDNWHSASKGIDNNRIYSLTTVAGGIIFAGTQDGIYRSVNYGATWLKAGLNRIAVTAITVNLKGIVFAATVENGVYRSTNSGSDWEQVNNGLKEVASVYALALAFDDVLLAGTNRGVFQSTNNGDTWKVAGRGLETTTVFSLAVNEIFDVFAGTDGAGVFKLRQNGIDWEPLSAGLSNLQVYSIAIDSEGFIFAGTNNGGIFYSTSSTLPEPKKLKITMQPQNSSAGDPVSPAPEVSILDAEGIIVTRGSRNIAMKLIEGTAGATLMGDTLVASNAGIATFTNISVDKSGSGYRLIAVSPGLIADTSEPFSITAGSMAQLAYRVQPGDGIAGELLSPQPEVDILDAYGNLVSTSSSNVRLIFGDNPSGGMLYGTKEVKAVAGVARFTDLSIDRTGDYTLVAIASVLSVTSKSFTIYPGAPEKLAYLKQPSNGIAGDPLSQQPVIAIQDAQGNVVESSSALVSVMIENNPSEGSLSGTTIVAAVNGLATFTNLSIDKAGVGYTLKVTSPGLQEAVCYAFDIVTGPAAKLGVLVQPGNGTPGGALSPQPVIAVQDAKGNTVPTSVASINMTIGNNPSGGTMSGMTTVSAVNGIAAFSNLTIDRSGAGYTLVASSVGLQSVTTAPFDVGNKATKLVFVVHPAYGIEGKGLFSQPIVVVEDVNGNIVDSSTANITLAIGNNPGGGMLNGTTTVQAVDGAAEFTDLSIDKPGSGYTLVATSGGLTSATSDPFNVLALPPVKLVFTTNPDNSSAGGLLFPQPVVEIKNEKNQTVSTSSVEVIISIYDNPAGGALIGTTMLNAVNGVAAFTDLRINKAGNGYTLKAVSTDLDSAISASFNITDLPPAKLGFHTQPGDGTAGEFLTPQPVVLVQDTAGNTVTSSNASVTLEIGDNPGNGALSGTTSVAAINGVATFTDLSIDKPGIGYTLIASASGISQITSEQFTVGSSRATSLGMKSGDYQSGEITKTLGSPCVVIVKDDKLNPVAGVDVSFVVGESPPGAAGQNVSASDVKTNSMGEASTFLILGDKIGDYTVVASSAGLSGSPVIFHASAEAPAYPASIALNRIYSYPSYPDPSDYSPQDYQIIGVPGDPKILVSDFMKGSQNTDWKVVWDNGSAADFFRHYDGSSIFQFSTGRAFWIIHRGGFTISRTVPTSSLDVNRSATIALHSGWNLITNPFDKQISWGKVQSVNATSEPLWSFHGIFSQSGNFEPYIGYYFDNRSGLQSLKIPYDSLFTAFTSEERQHFDWRINVVAQNREYVDSSLSFGISPSAMNSLDSYDFRKPHGIMESAGTHFIIDQNSDRYASDVRSAIRNVELWTLETRVQSGANASLSFGGMYMIPQWYSVILFDESRGRQVDLRIDSVYTFCSQSEIIRFKIIVGKPEYVRETVNSLKLARFELGGSFPNPISSEAIISVRTPIQTEIAIIIYNSLGARIRNLYCGLVEAGNHFFPWDCTADSGEIVPSGTYFYQLISDGAIGGTRKLLVVR